MRWSAVRAALIPALVLLLGAPVSAENSAAVVPASIPDARAVQELLHGTKGRREAWVAAPELVVLASVMDYASGDISNGYAATAEALTPEELSRLQSDLTAALAILSAGTLKAFSSVRIETVPVGRTVRVLRKGQIVVARYRGVRAKANTIGYGGRTARDGRITAATIILDSDFDRGDDLRRLLRTHELGHALGYNHVESLVSVMNPRIGPEVSDFDRAAARLAYAGQESAE
jgi:hypothetical protein